MVDIPLAISAITGAINLARDLAGIEREFNVAEYKLKVADLTTLLADVKLALTEARAEHLAKDSEISRLKTFLAKRDGETVEFNGFRYKKRSNGGPQGNPYCPVCELNQGILIHMTTSVGAGSNLRCPNCKAQVIAQRLFPYENDASTNEGLIP